MNFIKKRNLMLGLFLLGVLLGTIVLAYPILDSGIEGQLNEDQSPVYSYNFTKNVTGTISGSLIFSIDNINSSEHNYLDVSDYYWILIDSSTGNMTINATNDNETGAFNISVQVVDASSQGTIVASYFIVNATNDDPNFTNINNTYNLTKDQEFFEYLNATDEEEHYPLFFNISFFNNCTHASWTGRNAGENCSLFNLTSFSNTSSYMNFTPEKNDVGTYWANITIRDNGNNSLCPHDYCINSTYQQNKTSYRIVKFNVFSSLEVNVTDCQNKVFQENSSGSCRINISTKGSSDSLNVSTIAVLRNYDGSVSNSSWFYVNHSTNAVNFSKMIIANVTAEKTEIGNWTIYFIVEDTDSGENVTEQIYVYVNRTTNDAPEIVDIVDKDTSIDLQTRINITIYDDDLLIPDKNVSFGGYNESINFTVVILNQSNLSQELSLNGFDVEILNMPVSGTNKTEAKIEFTPTSGESGNYTINISIEDNENSTTYDLFNLSIISNSAPMWGSGLQTTFAIYEDSLVYLNLSQNVSDADGDSLTFSFTNDTLFPSFNFTYSEGIINFTPIDFDVGQNIVNVTVSDGYLTNTSSFNFTIYNVNDAPVIETPLTVTNASVESNSNITAQEDNYTTIVLWVHDDDFKIISAQSRFYDENLTVNVTITGPNTNLFSFIETGDFPTTSFPNRTEYEAIFTPSNTDVGNYNITVNVTDQSGSSNILEFNLTITGKNDLPIISSLTNQTTAVNRTFYYDINATDEEDGVDTSGNFTFNYTFLVGTDFINYNESVFNTTSGVLEFIFNDTYAGRYRINITVNDSSNGTSYDDFWVDVYGTPNITFPALDYEFDLQENSAFNLTFRANHSVQDNLTFVFYLDDVLKYNLSYYGNDTNLTWEFTPNFTDETYGGFENLTLVIYPSNSELENKSLVNYTLNWDTNITHVNSPVSFTGHIGDKEKAYNQDVTIDLTSYFSDIDHSDVNYNQTINFGVTSNSTPSYITSSVSSDWVLTLSSLIAVTELINVTANDSINTSTSNSFKVEFTTPSTVTVTTPSGGGSSTIPVSLKILMSDPVSAYRKDQIILPITLHNSGKKTLSGIDLTGSVTKNGELREDILISFDVNYLSSLAVGEKKNVTMTLDVNTEDVGTFEITINADVRNPKYSDWGKLYLTIKEGESLYERILFTQEFLESNPECMELEEVLDEAREYFQRGDFINTILKVNQAIDSCKNAISQEARAKRREFFEDPIYRYLIIAILFVFVVGLAYYSYQRMKLRRGLSFGGLHKNKMKVLAIFAFFSIIFSLFSLVDYNLTGSVINEQGNSNAGIFLILIIFCFLLGVFIFLKRKKIFEFIDKVKKKDSKGLAISLINKKVYSSSGDYLGKIKEVFLGKIKIVGIKIKLNKKKKFKVKGIVVKYNQVKSVGHILIIKKEVLKYLGKENI